jgi:hypothetical protein
MSAYIGSVGFRLVASLAAITAIACASPEYAVVESATVSDSAGTIILVNHRMTSEGQTLLLDSAPTVSIGADEADTTQHFLYPIAARLSDGRIVIGDRGNVWIFDASGKNARLIGRNPARIAVATNPEYSISIWSNHGKLERIVRRSNGRRIPTAEEKDGVREMLALRQNAPVTIERMLAETPVPDSLPAIAGLVMSPGGELVVQRQGFLAGGKSRYLMSSIRKVAGLLSGSFRKALTLPRWAMISFGQCDGMKMSDRSWRYIATGVRTGEREMWRWSATHGRPIPPRFRACTGSSHRASTSTSHRSIDTVVTKVDCSCHACDKLL